MLEDLDLVIPCFNEEAVLPYLFIELQKSFSTENLRKFNINKINYIFVNDGSSDNTLFLIEDFLRINKNGIVVNLSRNFGHQSAISAGFDNSTSSLIAVMDADLQDPSPIVLEMTKIMKEGYDVVYGIRKKRKENLLQVFCYWFYYRLISLLTDFKMALDSGDFAVYSRRMIDEMNKLPEKIRYHRGLRAWVGFPQIGYEYERMARYKGNSKYNFASSFAFAVNGIISMSVKPLKVALYFSMMFFCLTVVALTILIFEMGKRTTIDSTIILVSALVLLTTSFILFTMFIMSSYIGRSHVEIKNRPNYISKEILRFNI